MGALTDVQQLAPIYVKFSISEKALRRDFGGIEKIKKNAKVRAVLADGKGLEETAPVTLVDNKVNQRSNTVTMWATFQNKSLELLPGSFVTVQLFAADTPYGKTTVLPSALVMENGKYFVWILNPQNNIPVRKEVRIGETVAGVIEEQVNGIEDLLYFKSESDNNGNYTLTLTFQLGTLVNKVRKVTTAAGVGAGGYLAVSGSSTGAAIGTTISPGLGTLLGGILGCLIGAAAGGVAGNSVGKMVDENLVRVYQCPNGHEWRAA